MDRLVPGRWEGLRPPNEREMKATAVLALTIDEASAKIRSAPPGARVDSGLVMTMSSPFVSREPSARRPHRRQERIDRLRSTAGARQKRSSRP